MNDLIRYSRIETGFRREFLLLRGTGCRWRKCTFCDYHLDASPSPFEANAAVLEKVSGDYGVLDIINSGSAMEFDDRTVELIARTVREKGIEELWFEAHWMYRSRLKAFAENFDCAVHFRTGVESFNPQLRAAWNKGIDASVSPEMIRSYFDGVCLLAGVEGQSLDDIASSVEIAESLFDYYSVNVFCENTTGVRRDERLVREFIDRLLPQLRKSRKAEVLIENTDLGVG